MLSRRELLKATLIGGGLALSGFSLLQWLRGPLLTASTFIGKAHDYEGNLATLIRAGLRELGLTPTMVNGKRILLKPNLVEPHPSAPHINTHPLVVRGAIEAFLGLGAASVTVAEGPGHRHDTLLVLEESGLGDVLYEDRIPFHDVNMMEGVALPNLGRQTKLHTLTFPRVIQNQEGISQSILDINATLKPHFAIIDGITGMEGDGPIMGTPVHAGVIIMGQNLPAVDATCCRVMGIDPSRISYLKKADQWLGPIQDIAIEQRGEPWKTVQTPFQLEPEIPAHQGIRL
jgi:uncharacterized protein (DUF362 family)